MKMLPSSVSVDAIVGIWSDLASAYYGRNGFGGRVAEIYAYQLMSFDPRIEHEGMRAKARREQGIRAATAFWNIVTRFEQDWDCKCTIDGLSSWDWFQKSEPFDHRAHVFVQAGGES